MRSPSKQLRSYRERRALSKTNHSSTTDTKGLSEIQQSLKNQMNRHSFDQNLSYNEINCPEDSLDDVARRISSECDAIQKQQISITKIIQKYGNIHCQIIQVNEQDHFQSKQNSTFKVEKEKITMTSTKNLGAIDKKPLQSKIGLSKPVTKPDISNMVTPRRTAKQPLMKPFTKIQKKAQKKPVIVSKLQQNRFIKKMQLVDDEISKLGFQKEKEIRQLMKSVISLMKE